MTHDYEAQLVAAINVLLADAGMDLRVTHANTEAYTTPVPAGMGSLFASLEVWVVRREHPDHPLSWMDISWQWRHPGGGTNSHTIGTVGLNKSRSCVVWHAHTDRRPDGSERVGAINPDTLASEPLAKWPSTP